MTKTNISKSQKMYRERKECIEYMRGKKSYIKPFNKKALEKQKDKVRACFGHGAFFGNTDYFYKQELELIDRCIAGWDEYIKLL